ncbi:hypothetical protein B5C39_01100 [Mesomycoplasma hyopneumoniae]|nr:hypothetical protein [Mesomycoplasma hyopneumoniae]MXR10790.1 hypothetical protein [Mesomycoplasma hyopneumoniae]MXR12620.1 hypothetical protein [Mesomycoplasma hyopneumoniae]MXR33360.1 hypothetical protein [Mesomycoplasma hyopneumoniae]MXR34153.1 hypothetical protein [Mesomycoplasma hyopneumoniae]
MKKQKKWVEVKKISLKILTPKGVFLESSPYSVTVKTKLGYRIAQYGITPFVGVISSSNLHILNDNEKIEIPIKSGIVYANKYEVLIFSEDQLSST